MDLDCTIRVNGHRYSRTLVLETIQNLNKALAEDEPSVFELIEVCAAPEGQLEFDELDFLEEFNLLNPRGELKGVVRDVIIDCKVADGATTTFALPRKNI